MVDDPDNPYRAPASPTDGPAIAPRPPRGRGFRWQVIPATLCGFMGALLGLGYLSLAGIVPPTGWLPGLGLGALSVASFLLASRSWFRRTNLAGVLWTVAGIACHALSGRFNP